MEILTFLSENSELPIGIVLLYMLWKVTDTIKKELVNHNLEDVRLQEAQIAQQEKEVELQQKTLNTLEKIWEEIHRGR